MDAIGQCMADAHGQRLHTAASFGFLRGVGTSVLPRLCRGVCWSYLLVLALGYVILIAVATVAATPLLVVKTVLITLLGAASIMLL